MSNNSFHLLIKDIITIDLLREILEFKLLVSQAKTNNGFVIF